MNAHTPGPWTVGRDSEGDWQIHKPDPDGNPIAIVRGEDDARLVAAAPDLYEAVNDAMEYLEEQVGDCEPDCHCIIHALRAAIAKVEGK
jgi:hypothetical protein